MLRRPCRRSYSYPSLLDSWRKIRTSFPYSYSAVITTNAHSPRTHRDPTVRLDLAPSLNWLSRRSVLAAIHSGQLTIEPIPAASLFPDLSSNSSLSEYSSSSSEDDEDTSTLEDEEEESEEDERRRRRHSYSKRHRREKERDSPSLSKGPPPSPHFPSSPYFASSPNRLPPPSHIMNSKNIRNIVRPTHKIYESPDPLPQTNTIAHDLSHICFGIPFP